MEELEQLEADLNDSMQIVDWEIRFEESEDLDEDQTTSEDEESEDEEIEDETEEEVIQEKPKKQDKYAKLLAERNAARKEAEKLAEKEAYIADLEAKLQKQNIEEDDEEEEMTFQQLAQKEAQKVVKNLLEQQKKELEQARTLDSVVKKYEADEYRSEIEKYLETHKSVSIEDATVVTLKQKAPHLLLNGFDEGTRNRIVWVKNSIKGHSKPTSQADTIEMLEKQLREWWGR